MSATHIRPRGASALTFLDLCLLLLLWGEGHEIVLSRAHPLLDHALDTQHHKILHPDDFGLFPVTVQALSQGSAFCNELSPGVYTLVSNVGPGSSCLLGVVGKVCCEAGCSHVWW